MAIYSLNDIVAALRLVKMIVEELMNSRILFFFAKRRRSWLKDRLMVAINIIEFVVQLLLKNEELFNPAVERLNNPGHQGP
ncbi:hypothetical protein ACFLZW_05695 [Chloroflexota bacterium]